MGIGFVVIVWLGIIIIVAVSYFLLKILAEDFYIFDVLKDALLAIIGVFIVLVGVLIFINFTDYVFQNVYPTRIFTSNFKFNPTSDVEIIKGSYQIFAEKAIGRISLKFKANEKTIEKIIKNREFNEAERKNFSNADDGELRKLSNDENAEFYHSTNFASDCDPDNGNCHAYLVYEKQSGEAYFSW